jgi:hypothetical protein
MLEVRDPTTSSDVQKILWTYAAGTTNRLLKKSVAVAGEDGVVAIVERQLDFD